VSVTGNDACSGPISKSKTTLCATIRENANATANPASVESSLAPVHIIVGDSRAHFANLAIHTAMIDTEAFIETKISDSRRRRIWDHIDGGILLEYCGT
jgi:hypothetical protein